MDARGVQRLLEKILGMAETADHVGMRHAETMQREPRLSDAAKAKLGKCVVNRIQIPLPEAAPPGLRHMFDVSP